MAIEGPYGKFDFNDPCEVQVWAAGGGVWNCAFLSRLKSWPVHLPRNNDDTFYYCTRDDRFLQHYLLDLCQRVGVHLHLINRNASEVLNVDELLEYGRDNRLSIWYAARRSWVMNWKSAWHRIMHKGKFHRESFDMR